MHLIVFFKLYVESVQCSSKLLVSHFIFDKNKCVRSAYITQKVLVFGTIDIITRHSNVRHKALNHKLSIKQDLIVFRDNFIIRCLCFSVRNSYMLCELKEKTDIPFS